jgi:hypothetical protein
MAHPGRLSTTLLVVCVASAISCSRGSRDESDTTAGNPPSRDKCADFNGDGGGKVRGNLKGKGQAARSVAAQIGGVEAKGKNHPRERVRLIPTCKNSTLDRADLYEGRFVGLLTGDGLNNLKLSNTPNDIVAWWIYGTTSGKADTTWHSQFLSLRGPAHSDPKIDTMIVCGPAKDHVEDAVDWHAGACPAVAASATAGGADTVEIRPGDKPWFGCKLGCCISAMNIS